MKLNIDWEGKTITLLDDWNLETLHSKLKELCGNEEANWDKWTIKQEVKTVIFPQKELVFKEYPLSNPYKPFDNQPLVTYDGTGNYTPRMQNVSFKNEDLTTNTYSHT